MSIGAVIVTYQTKPRILQQCLVSLNTDLVSNIVIVDNSPNSLPVKTDLIKQNIVHLAQSENIGFAAAANIGARQLNNKYLLFINPDATIAPNAAATAVRYMDKHLQCGIVGFLLTSPTKQPETHSFGKTVTPISLFTRNFRSFQLPATPTVVGWVSGGALMIRHNVFTQLKGFDAQFFLYWEDVDLCRRAGQNKWQVVLMPQSQAIHHRGASSNNNQLKTKLYDQSADKYFCKHYAKSICISQHHLRRIYRFFSPLVD